MSDSMSQHCPNCEAQAAEIELLREEVKELMDELAYHGVYPRPLEVKAEQ